MTVLVQLLSSYSASSRGSWDGRTRHLAKSSTVLMSRSKGISWGNGGFPSNEELAWYDLHDVDWVNEIATVFRESRHRSVLKPDLSDDIRI